MNQNNPKKGNRFALLVISSLIIYPIFHILLNIASNNRSSEISSNMVIEQLISQLIIFGVPLAIYFYKTKERVSDTIPMKRLSLVNALLIVLMTISIMPLTAVIDMTTNLFVKNIINEEVFKLYSHSFLLAFFAIAIIPPIMEELVYRGVFLSNYNNIPIKTAALINGLFFGLMHANFGQFFYAFIIGIILSYFVHYTKSIYASIIPHFILNGISISIGFLQFKSGNYTQSEYLEMISKVTFDEKIKELLFWVVIAAIFTPVFIIIFRSFISYNKRLLLTDEMLINEDYNNENTDTDEENNGFQDVSFDNTTKEIEHETPVHKQKINNSIFTPSFWIYIFITVTEMVAVLHLAK